MNPERMAILIVFLMALHVVAAFLYWRLCNKFYHFKELMLHRLDAHTEAINANTEEAEDLFRRAAARGIAIGEFLGVEFEYENPRPGKWKAVKKTTKKTTKK